MLDLSRIGDQPPLAAANAAKDLAKTRNASPTVDSQINEVMLKGGIQRHVPLKWDPNGKRWMGPDQIVVETAFHLPFENEQGSPSTAILPGSKSSAVALSQLRHHHNQSQPQVTSLMQQRNRPQSSPGQTKYASL